MKKTLDGKIYNTDTATELASWDNGCYVNDFHHVSETLYRTPKGALFLVCDGGALSIYGSGGHGAGGNESWPGDEWRVMTEEDAVEWCEQRDCQDAIETHFSHLVEEA